MVRFADYLSPVELRRLVAGLVGVLTALLVFFVFALLLIPGGRNANRPATRAPVVAVAGESGWLVPTEYPPAPGYDVPPLDPATVLQPTPQLVARGRDLFTRNCAACHGPDGAGDGPAANGLRPAPRDLTRGAAWTNGPTLPAIFRTLETGVPGSAMVAWDFLGQRNRMALVHYVRSLARFTLPAEDPARLAALEKELAAAGEHVPPRIPVSAAITRLIAEAHTPPPLALAETSAEALRWAVADAGRVAQVLALAPDGWRSGPQQLADLLGPEVPGNGFHTGVTQLSSDEWRALGEALVQAVPASDRGKVKKEARRSQ